MQIRYATFQDKDAIAHIIKTSLGYNELDGDKFAPRFQKILDNSDFITLVCEIDGNVCGFLGAKKEISYEQDDEYIRILDLAVNTEIKGHGIGKLLIEKIQSIAKDNGSHLITFSSSFHRTDAHRFYEKNGFPKTGYTFKKKI